MWLLFFKGGNLQTGSSLSNNKESRFTIELRLLEVIGLLVQGMQSVRPCAHLLSNKNSCL